MSQRQPFAHYNNGGNKRKYTSQNLDRLLSRAPPQANFNINYEAYTILIPNYSFGKPTLLPGSGGLMAIAIGKRLSDELPVLAKLSPYTIRLEREYYIARRLYSQPDGKRYIPQVVELVTLSQDGLTALIYADKGANDDLVYLEQRFFSHYRLSVSSPPLQQYEGKSSSSPSSPPPINTSPIPSSSSCSYNPLIDINTFLKFAIECCSCLQLLHSNGIIHGELRPSAFHWHTTEDDGITVKIWNFGAGLKSYEDMLLTSSGWRRAVMAAATHDDLLDDPTILDPSSRFLPTSSTRGFQHALAYVSPEQTGRTSNVLDHRTDLYSLGIMFFVILTGQTPFEGSPMSVIQAALSQNVPLVHTIRSDVPTALSLIIDKMTRKAVDERYNSAYGVREDLIECLRRLQGEGDESLLFFPLALHDINSVFQFPSAIFGREHEIELLRAAILRSAQREYDQVSSTSTPTRISSPLDKPLSEVIVITGPGGIGKSTLVSAIHNYARQYGYLGTAKFDSNQQRPYNGLLRCLSSILRQLLTESETVIQDFYCDLKQQLGPHFSNVRLMVGMVPELKPILSDHDHNDLDEDMIPNAESRFHAVFLNVLRTITQKKPITLFLDDLLEADEASLYLISSLIDARIKMLIILTCRDVERLPDCIRDELVPDNEMPDAHVTTIKLAPLGIDAIHQLVNHTLHRTLDAVRPLGEIVYHRTHGNPFYAKQFLLMMKRKGDLWFDWDDKQWKFRLDNIAQILYPPKPSNNRGGSNNSNNSNDPGFTGAVLDVQHLVSYLKEMDQHTQAFLMWASLIGSAFDFRQIKWLMVATDLSTMDDSATDPACSDFSDSVSVSSCTSEQLQQQRTSFVEQLEHAPMDAYHSPTHEDTKRGNQIMAALQMALHEGIIQTTVGNNHYQFTHDRYYQAAAMLIDEKDRERMHLRIGQMFMVDSDSDDVFMMADHFVKSVDLIKRFRNRTKYRQVLCKAGEEAVNSGASRIGHTYYSHAMALLPPNPWVEDEDIFSRDSSYRETLDLYLRMAELEWWSNRRTEADHLLDEIMAHTANRPVERARAWRVQARMYFQLQQNDRGIEAIIDALRELGMNDVFLKDEPVPLPADNSNPAHILLLYTQVKQQIMDIGFEALRDRERCKDRRILAIMTLLNEACTGAYWLSPHLVDLVAIKLVQLSLKHGYGVTSGSGFTWLGCTAARLKEYEFGAKLGELGLDINGKYGGNPEIAQAIVVYHGMLSQWSGCHFRNCIAHFERAYKYAVAGGDKIFSSMALFHISTTLFYTGCNLSELQSYLDERIDESADDEKDVVLTLNVSLWRTVLALQGKTTVDKDMQQVLDDYGIADSSFKERLFLDEVHRQSSNAGSIFNWHWSLKIIVLVHFDRHHEAAQLGFKILDTAIHHPGHRHIGIAIFYHTIALIACLRDDQLDDATRNTYHGQIDQNREMLQEWATHATTNYQMYKVLVDAEMATLTDDPKAAQLYNDALELGTQGKWYPFLALAYQLIAEQYIRRNMRMLAMPMLQEALGMYNAVDAWGVAHHLTEKHDSVLNNNDAKMVQPVDVAVQTDEQDVYQSVEHGAVWDEILPTPTISELSGSDSLTSEAAILSLDIVDLTSIIKSSQVISNEMNSFDELLKKMMGIIMTNSAAESGAIIIKEGSFGVAAHSNQSGCETYDPPMPLNDDKGLISTLVVHYVIHTQTILFIPNIREDTRFATGNWFAHTGPKSVICIPCIHKNTLVGVLYLQANLNTFTPKHVTVLHILCHQIGISITNALLFKSVQKATQANARMIEKQREALEEARSSREQALKATKLKSNFLANMSHELRTPFSGFYGMIDLLTETQLDPEQREFVFIAKQSCEMLLQIIDDLLDFSKLEARKVKLHCGLFYIEDLIEDRVELLITLASNKKLELTCFTDPDVPPMIYGDGNRIGQILMNLIGNAIKFTQQGEVVVRCSVEKDPPGPPLKEDELMLKFSVQDTGIGMSMESIKSLFVPFSQVDGSTTRNFGGTGLGLSICLELVRLMGGDIWVDSEINQGSTFHFRVRVMKPSSVAEPGVDSDRRHREIEELIQLVGPRRLLLSTSARQADMIKGLLPTLDVVRVDTPQQGLEVARVHAKEGQPFDCFLVDAPPSEAMREIIDATEMDPILRGLHILLLYAPAMDSIRRQIVAGKAVRSELQQHAYDARVTRITKPVRRGKLLKTFIQVFDLKVPSYLSNHHESLETERITPPTPLVSTIARGAAAALTRRVHETEDDTIPTNTISAENEPHDIKPSFSSPYMKQRSNEAFTPEELAIFQGQRILVAEDNPVAQKLLVKQLARLGFVVETCNNGFECIKTWTKRGPEYFLLAWIDHHMPGCDGIEATKKIRQLEAEMHVAEPMPIIALTADVQKTAQQKCLDAGMTDYLVKPLMQKDLAAVLRRYCSPQHLYTPSS